MTMLRKAFLVLNLLLGAVLASFASWPTSPVKVAGSPPPSIVGAA